MKKTIIILAIMLMGVSSILAQGENKTEKSNSAAQANNPLANMTAINLQNYYMPKFSNASGESYMNSTWLRFATPFAKGKLLLRVSAPITTIGNYDNITEKVNTTNGLGDANAFLSYNFISKPSATMGIGPLLSAPTATEAALGTEKWQGGLAFVAFIAKSPIFQYGGLVTWQTSFAGNENRPNTNMMAVQPFYFWQLGKGTYMRGAPIWTFDFENNNYNVPFALGIGKVVKVEQVMYNLFIEPQYSILSKGFQPQLQIFTGINIQILNQ
jgi:hypothetical protein